MENHLLYLFWVIVTALFVFAMVYAWFIAIIVRKPLPGTMTWMLAGLAFYTAINAFIRMGATIIDPLTLVIVQRGLILVIAIDACVMAVQLGISYNGAVSNHLPLPQQVRMLLRACTHKEAE